MYLLGHTGFTCAFARLTHNIRVVRVPESLQFVLLGSMLPDLIDKPLGFITGINNGRMWGHTLLFSLSISLVALALLRRRSGSPWGVALFWSAFGSWMHLLLDRIWEQPDVVLYPTYGWGFPQGYMTIEGLWDLLWSEPFLLATEILGGILLLLVALERTWKQSLVKAPQE